MTDAKKLSSHSRKHPHGGDKSPASAKHRNLRSAGEDKGGIVTKLEFPLPEIPWRYKVMRQPFTLVEINYLAWLNEVLNKPNWWKKYEDTKIVEKWKAECDLTPRAFETMLKELAFIAKNELVSGISPTSALGTFIADCLINPEQVSEFKKLVLPLEKRAFDNQQYHPGTDNQVLDIVHPSLYCCVYGKTMGSASPNALLGDICVQPPPCSDQRRLSRMSSTYQWLPSEFHVDSEGKVKINSYINNINREDHPRLYEIIATIFEKMIPLFERTLASFDKEPRCRSGPVDTRSACPPRYEYYSRTSEECCMKFIIKHFPNPDDRPVGENMEKFIDEHEDEFDEFLGDFCEEEDSRKVEIPELPDFEDFKDFPDVVDSIPACLHDRSLQVIVKIANIHLTPDNPRYKGGVWHVEGMENEAIAAQGIYYYDFENITLSCLSLRQVYDQEYDFDYDQNDHLAVCTIYGIENEGTENVQPTGKVNTMENRIVTFPNFLHHRVEPFELLDKSKPGHRKILCFFLVHPDVKIVGTKNVPPQQDDLIEEELMRLFCPQLPTDIVCCIKKRLWTMTVDDAKQHMVGLMDERKVDHHFGFENVQEISLCEH